jgi:PIN domain nuclease of toxin-antitoxin system
VNYLLDTSAFLWAVAAPGKLSPTVRKLIENRKNSLFVSAASLWEVIVKAQKGLLPITNPPSWLKTGLESIETEVLPIQAEHVYAVARLPMIHKDPFDRILVAQAASEGWPLVTNDALVRRYEIEIVW